MRRSLGLMVLLTVLASMVAGTVAVPSPAQAAPSAAKYLAEARKYTNHERTIRDRPALGNSECLARFARAQAARMAKAGRIYHTENFDSIGRTCKLRAWGENVAQAAGSDTGRGVVRMWMNSSGHKANILNKTYRHFGMGAVYRDGKWWVVQVFGRRA
jgi:uncharacterized protein YkwD